MTRLLKYSAPLLAAAAMLAFVSIGQAQDSEISLDGVNLGTHVHGPEVDAEDLAGKVVVFEYWGDRCGPCLNAIPHLVDVQEEHGDDLVIVANQVWTQDVAAARRAWTNAGGNASVAVINHGALDGAPRRMPVPRSFIFDHEGELLWTGHPMNPEFEATIEAAIADLPSPAATTEAE